MHVYDTTYSKSHSKGLRTEKVCVKGASHLGELGNVKPIKLANFGPSSWRSNAPSAHPMNHISYLNKISLRKMLIVPFVMMFLALLSTERVSCPTVDKYFMM